jgi:membrane associated rhomboid family serine protease
MGIYDRDYTRVDYAPRRRAPAFGSARMWSVTTWLIIINVVVFVLDRFLDNATGGYNFYIVIGQYQIPQHYAPIEYWGHFSALTAIAHLQVWRFITFQFLHASPGHLFYNMLALFFFGPIMESYLGSRRYLLFYLLCGVAGAFSYLVLWGMHLLVTASWQPLVGASAGIFGILIAAAQVAPDSVVLIWGIVPMRLRLMAWILLAIAVYTVLTMGQNAGGEAAHLGGAIAGVALIRNPQVLRFVDSIGAPSSRMRYRR